MLALEARNSNDHRTVGGLFYPICEEMEDIRFSTALILILDLLRRTLEEFPLISEELADTIINSFFNGLLSI